MATKIDSSVQFFLFSFNFLFFSQTNYGNHYFILFSGKMKPVKERSQDFRKKLRTDGKKYHAHLQRDRDRKRKKCDEEMKAGSFTEEKMRDICLATKLRIRRHRQKETESRYGNKEDPNSLLGSFSSQRYLSRAVKKVKRSLPDSPRRQKAILASLVQEKCRTFIFKDQKKKRNPRRKSFSEEVRDKFIAFYNRDDISWTAPGRKNSTSAKDAETEEKKWVLKRFLMMSISEAKSILVKKMETNYLVWICFLS